MRLSGKRVLTIGASGGLGRASALAIAAEGARVCLAARRIDRIREAATEAGNECFALACDVRDEASCEAVVDGAAAEMGGLDAVVYAPGIATFSALEETDAAAWRAVLETNLIGPSLILRAAIGHLEASRGKAVIFSSIVVHDSPPRPKHAAYVTSKVALETLIEAWQAEHRSVGFTALANGDAWTEFSDGHDLADVALIAREWQQQGYLFGRMMEISAITEQVVNALASSETIRRIAITPNYA